MVHRTREDGEVWFGERNSHLMNDGDDPERATPEVMGRVIQSKLHPVLSSRTKTSRRHSKPPTSTPCHITKSIGDKLNLANREVTFKKSDIAAMSSAEGDGCLTSIASDVCFAGLSSSSLALSGLSNTPSASVISGSVKPKKKSKIARLFGGVRHIFCQNSRHKSHGWLRL